MTGTPEHALYISDPADLKHFYNSRFDRIYFGNEFCQFLLPTKQQVEAVREFAERAGVGFTLVTPVCAESGLKATLRLLDTLPANTEVVINDLGVLAPVLDRGLFPIHGRLLCKIKKDPRLKDPALVTENDRNHNLLAPYQKFIGDLGISRIEIDNVFQGMNLDLEQGMKASLYYPFTACSATRKCYFANMAEGNEKFRTIPACPVHCEGQTLPIETSGETLFMMGNAHFYVNGLTGDVLAETPADRLVYMPVIPNFNSFSDKTFNLDWETVYREHIAENLWDSGPDEVLAKVLKESTWESPKKVLDIGCGTGRHTEYFRDDEYYGIDISESAIEQAAAKNKGNFVCASVFDNLEEKLGTSFDIALDYGCFHTIAPYMRRAYFENIHRIMNPGATLFLCSWHDRQKRVPVFFLDDQLPEWACSVDDLNEEAEGLFYVEKSSAYMMTQREMLFAVMKKAK